MKASIKATVEAPSIELKGDSKITGKLDVTAICNLGSGGAKILREADQFKVNAPGAPWDQAPVLAVSSSTNKSS